MSGVAALDPGVNHVYPVTQHEQKKPSLFSRLFCCGRPSEKRPLSVPSASDHRQAWSSDEGLLENPYVLKLPEKPISPGAKFTHGYQLDERKMVEMLNDLFRFAKHRKRTTDIYKDFKSGDVARSQLTDVAIVLSLLRTNGAKSEECDRIAKELCRLLNKDKLENMESGFVVFSYKNHYVEIEKIKDEMMRMWHGLPNKKDVFDRLFEEDIFPTIQLVTEACSGPVEAERWAHAKPLYAAGLFARVEEYLVLYKYKSITQVKLRELANQWRISASVVAYVATVIRNPSISPTTKAENILP